MEPNKFTHDGSMGIVLCTYQVIQSDLFILYLEVT